MLSVAVARSSYLTTVGSTLCTSGFADDVMFYRNGPYDVCHCWYLHERRAGASSRKFATYSPGGATQFDFVSFTVAALAGTACRALSVVDGLQRAV